MCVYLAKMSASSTNKGSLYPHRPSRTGKEFQAEIPGPGALKNYAKRAKIAGRCVWQPSRKNQRSVRKFLKSINCIFSNPQDFAVDKALHMLHSSNYDMKVAKMKALPWAPSRFEDDVVFEERRDSCDFSIASIVNDDCSSGSSKSYSGRKRKSTNAFPAEIVTSIAARPITVEAAATIDYPGGLFHSAYDAQGLVRAEGDMVYSANCISSKENLSISSSEMIQPCQRSKLSRLQMTLMEFVAPDLSRLSIESCYWCFLCRRSDPDLICSKEGCERRFHSSCASAHHSIDPGSGKWMCPSHHCAQCLIEDKSPSSALVTCLGCAATSCENHFGKALSRPDIRVSFCETCCRVALSSTADFTAVIYHINRLLYGPTSSHDRIPNLGKKPLDILLLYRGVLAHGGAVEVTRCKLWKQLGRIMNLPSTITNASSTLRKHYVKLLFPLEQLSLRSSMKWNPPVAANALLAPVSEQCAVPQDQDQSMELSIQDEEQLPFKPEISKHVYHLSQELVHPAA